MDPWSDSIYLGMQVYDRISASPSATETASTRFNGIAYGYIW